MTRFSRLVLTSWSTGFLLALTLTTSSLMWSLDFFTISNGMFSLIGCNIFFSSLDKTLVPSWVFVGVGNLVITIDDFEGFLTVLNDFCSNFLLCTIGSANCFTGLLPFRRLSYILHFPAFTNPPYLCVVDLLVLESSDPDLTCVQLYLQRCVLASEPIHFLDLLTQLLLKIVKLLTIENVEFSMNPH